MYVCSNKEYVSQKFKLTLAPERKKFGLYVLSKRYLMVIYFISNFLSNSLQNPSLDQIDSNLKSYSETFSFTLPLEL